MYAYTHARAQEPCTLVRGEMELPDAGAVGIAPRPYRQRDDNGNTTLVMQQAVRKPERVGGTLTEEDGAVDGGGDGPAPANSLTGMPPDGVVLPDGGTLLSWAASLTTSKACSLTIARICAMLICDGVPSAAPAVEEGGPARDDDDGPKVVSGRTLESLVDIVQHESSGFKQ